ncbi:MAG: hypothetical protein RR555_09110, partial [Bacteroidales bacterium]
IPLLKTASNLIFYNIISNYFFTKEIFKSAAIFHVYKLKDSTHLCSKIFVYEIFLRKKLKQLKYLL